MKLISDIFKKNLEIFILKSQKFSENKFEISEFEMSENCEEKNEILWLMTEFFEVSDFEESTFF